MVVESEWERFFDGHAPAYMDNCFTQATEAEIAFLMEELRLPAGARILDVGCGTGRHSVRLAGLGYQVTGVDLSTGMLAEAAKAAAAAGVTVDWIHADATRLSLPAVCDAAICLGEGSLGLLSSGEDPIEHDLSILRNIHAALKPGGRLVLTALSALRMVRQATPEDVLAGRFDPLAMEECGTMEFETPEGPQSVPTRERGYVPTEMRLLLRCAGLEVENLWGGTAGNWGRRPLDLDEMEMMAVARKPAQ